MRTLTFVLVVLCVLTPFSVAQSSLTTTYFHNNGQSGNMFDIVATNAVTIVALEVNIDAQEAEDMEVYVVTGGGSFTGLEHVFSFK